MPNRLLVLLFAPRLCIGTFLILSPATISQAEFHLRFRVLRLGSKGCFKRLDSIFIVTKAAINTAQYIVNLRIARQEATGLLISLDSFSCIVLIGKTITQSKVDKRFLSALYHLFLLTGLLFEFLYIFPRFLLKFLYIFQYFLLRVFDILQERLPLFFGLP